MRSSHVGKIVLTNNAHKHLHRVVFMEIFFEVRVCQKTQSTMSVVCSKCVEFECLLVSKAHFSYFHLCVWYTKIIVAL